jgi:ABC-type multidrug transport system permease subunit
MRVAHGHARGYGRDVLAYLDTSSGGSIGGLLVLALFFGLYLALCWSIAKYAERKGQNLALFFVLGLLVSPIVSFISALLINDPRQGA